MDRKAEKSFMEAFEELAPRLYRFCLIRVGSKPLAEDLVSDTFLKTWQYINRGEKVQSYPVFLHRVLKNLIVDHWRSKSRKELPINDELVETLVSSSDLPSETSTNLEYMEVIDAIQNLPAAEAEAIELRFVQEFSVKEIAQLTGKKPNAVYVSIFRGIQKLKKAFKDEKDEKNKNIEGYV